MRKLSAIHNRDKENAPGDGALSNELWLWIPGAPLMQRPEIRTSS
jgi:hypothetical protein